ncbi:hypothetical protein M427DRAFT_183149 [Gonapodya prolifera JEL478]|uniref:Uncharacterized protein n=1 Tax=Gonapodya prolifera (strain JEL478) TaxID=1344416 RepID=A0A139A0R0_GONPJ|nr:hypothetical protein M427DRAFT_183149 [Gonapodya prolifera JEL478]|eukprot:KXS10360.1 hypothetical protein M427DRAFT_183149 [Gonapodya prolifera JEL478]
MHGSRARRVVVQNALWRANLRPPAKPENCSDGNTEHTPWHILTPMPPRERVGRLPKVNSVASSTNPGVTRGDLPSITYDRVVVGRGAAAVVRKEFVKVSKRVHDRSFVPVERPEPPIPCTRRRVTLVRDLTDEDSVGSVDIAAGQPELSPSSRQRCALPTSRHRRIRPRSERIRVW